MNLDRLTSVLETVAAAGRPVQPVELQQATALPRPTCYRVLQSLTEGGLLKEAEGGGYLIGDWMVRIAMLGQTDSDVRSAAAPTLKQAAIGLGEAVFLSRFRNKGVEIIHVETPSDPARSYVHPGLGFRPMHACSCSKAIAAFADQDFRDEIAAGPLRAFTEHTRTSGQAIQAELSEIRRTGYAECVEEIELGVSSVAAPILVGTTGAIYSVGATGPIRRFSTDRRQTVGEELITIAGKISAALKLAAIEQSGSALPPQRN